MILVHPGNSFLHTRAFGPSKGPPDAWNTPPPDIWTSNRLSNKLRHLLQSRIHLLVRYNLNVFQWNSICKCLGPLPECHSWPWTPAGDGRSPGRGYNVTTTLLRTFKLYVSIHISAWQWHMHDHGRPVVNQPLSNPNIPNDLASSHAVSPVSLLMHSPVGPFDPLASAEVRKSPAPGQYLTSRFTVCCWYLPYQKIIGLDSIWTCPFWGLFQP